MPTALALRLRVQWRGRRGWVRALRRRPCKPNATVKAVERNLGGFCVWPDMRTERPWGSPSGSRAQLLECRIFQSVEVAYARRRLLKDMLRHFKPSDRLSRREAMIADDLVQRLPHDGNRGRIEFLFQLGHRRSLNVERILKFFCNGKMK